MITKVLDILYRIVRRYRQRPVYLILEILVKKYSKFKPARIINVFYFTYDIKTTIYELFFITENKHMMVHMMKVLLLIFETFVCIF